MMKFSKTTGCFYPDDIDYPSPPQDLIEVPQEDFDTAAARTAGDTLDVVDGRVVVVPKPAQTLAEAQAVQIAILSGACELSILAGFSSSALGDSYSYPAQLTDQQNLVASATDSLMPGLPPDWVTPLWCCTASGEWAMRPHSASQTQQAARDGKAAILAAMEKNQQLAAKVRAATTIAAVQAVTWN